MAIGVCQKGSSVSRAASEFRRNGSMMISAFSGKQRSSVWRKSKTRNEYGSASLFHLFPPPPTTSQSVFPAADQRLPFTSVWILRGSCGGNRRTPLTGESERVLPQRGHSTTVTALAVNRLRSMGIIVRENGHLGDVLVCTGSFAVATVFVVEARSFSWTVCRSGSFPFTLAGSALF